MAGTIIGFAYAESSPERYRATSTSFVASNLPPTTSNGTPYQQSLYVLQRVVSYRELVTSPRVLQPVIDKLKIATTEPKLAARVAAANPEGTVLLEVTVTDSSANQAANLATAIGRQAGIVIEQLEATRTATRTGRAVSSPSVKVAMTKEASVPSAPFSPNKRVDVALGIILGLIVGLSWAFIRARFDRSVRSGDELVDASGMALLGSVAKSRRRDAATVVTPEARGPLADSYRVIRDRIQLSGGGATLRLLVVTSAGPVEARPAVAANVAATFAQSGRRVCLVEADMRHGRLSKLLGINASTGLSDVLEHRSSLDDSMVRWRDGRMSVLAAGSVPTDPTGLLGSLAMRELAAQLSARFDLVVFDCPPVLSDADGLLLGQLSDGVVVVVAAGKTTADDVAAGTGTLEDMHLNVLGGVLVGSKQAQTQFRPRSGPARDVEPASSVVVQTSRNGRPPEHAAPTTTDSAAG